MSRMDIDAIHALDAHRFDRLGLDVTRRLGRTWDLPIKGNIGWQSDTHFYSRSLEFMKAVLTSRVLLCNFEVLM